MDVRMPPTKCSKCKATLDGASQVKGEEQPTPGDISMCFYCGTLHMFDEGLALRRMSFAELNALDDDTRALLARMQASREMLN